MAILRPLAQRQGISIFMDIIFIEKIPFLVGMTKPMNYVMVEVLNTSMEKGPSKTAPVLAKAMNIMVDTMAARRFDVQTIEFDREPAIAPIKKLFKARDISVRQGAAGAHNAVGEAAVKKVKTKYRYLTADIPFAMCRFLIIMGVYCRRRLQ